MELKENLSINTHPIVKVNEIVVNGSINCEPPITVQTCTVLAAICAEFANGTQPSICGPSSSPSRSPTSTPTIPPTLAPTISPSMPPTKAPTPICPNLRVEIIGSSIPFDKALFEGLYTYESEKFSAGRPVFEVLSNPLDQNIQYQGVSPNGYWIIEGIGQGSFPCTNCALYPPYDSSSSGWIHNNISISGSFTLLISCVETFAPTPAPSFSPSGYTEIPTMPPTPAPSNSPLPAPAPSPTAAPSGLPSGLPSEYPSQRPTQPTISPTISPSQGSISNKLCSDPTRCNFME